MANKLNAFLASVPANGLPSPVRQHQATPPPPPAKPLPALATSFSDLSLKTPPAPPTPLPRSHAAQPATPQPPQKHRRNGSRRAKKFESHFHKSDSARNLSLAVADARKDSGGADGDDASNQEETEPRPQQQALSPLKAFDPSARGRRGAEPPADGEAEAGPLRRLSAQGSHHRRVSTDTTMFSRYLRQQADRDINMDVVQYFSTVPVATLSRGEDSSGTNGTIGTDGTIGADDCDNNNNVSTGTNSADEPVVDPLALLRVFERGGAVSTASALEVLRLATNALSLEPNVLSLAAPCTLVGDLHGQFQDLLAILGVHGLPARANQFLFLGDYVDRGAASCEIVLLLLAFKVALPASVHLLRGNHECRSLSTFYGFRTECLRKYGTAVYNRMVKCFESMPLAARLETSYGVFLAVHGGLSPAIARVDDIERVNRFMEPEPAGALCDLLWSDPAKDGDAAQREPWAPNTVRGCSYTFSEQACRDFLARNGLLAIIRAHELEEDGFREHFGSSRRASGADGDGDTNSDAPELPPVVTVFSAPEYCNTNHNMGATLSVAWERRANVLEYRQHKRSAQREHEFALASEDEAVKALLADALPFLPLDFYALVAHCRQLKHALALPRQASLGPVDASSKSSFALELELRPVATNTPSPRPSDAPSPPRSAAERATSSDAAATPFGKPNARRAQAVTAVDAPREAAADATTTTEAADEDECEPAAPRALAGGWRLCPGFLRVWRRVWGGGRPTHAPPAPAAVDASSTAAAPDEDDALAAAPMNNQRSSSAGASPAASPSALAAVAPAPMQLESMFPGQAPKGPDVFSAREWRALKLYFALLDVSGNGVLMEESFVVLLAEQDSDAYATEDELTLLMEVIDTNADGLITEQDFLLFAYRSYLRWKKMTHKTPALS